MAIIIFIIVFSTFIAIITITKNRRKCNHDWELIVQKVYCFECHKTFECKKCGKRKFIEEWCD